MMKKQLKLLGAAIIVTLASVAPSLAMSFPIGKDGGPASAPEIGAGLAGMLLAASAARYFRQRARG